MLLGFALLAATIYVTYQGIRNPSTGSSIAIALLGSIGVPIGLGAISVGWRWRQEPSALDLRTESEAKRRAAAALEDAETAEKIKAEMTAYVALRARRLEIDRRRTELSRAAQTLVELHNELKDAEAQLNLEITEVDSETREILDRLTEPRPRIELPEIGMPASGIGVLAWAVSRIAEASMEWSLSAFERRRLRRLARVAPDALAPGKDSDQPNDGKSS